MVSAPDLDRRPLVPVWFRVVAIGVPLLATVGLAALAATSTGALAALGWTMTTATALTLVAAVAAVGVPRRRRALPGPPEVVVISSPAPVAVALVGAWIAALLAAVLTVVVALGDVGDLEAPGAAWALVVGALASLPDLVRLLTGRLHRWRVTLTPEAITYRGYRTDTTIPWSKVHGARLQDRHPAGILIDRKGTGPDPVVPAAAFTLPPEQLVEEIERHLAAHRR